MKSPASTTAASEASPTPWPQARWLAPALAVVLLVSSLYVLHRELEGTHWRDVIGMLRSLPSRALLLAVACTTLSYLLLGQFDRLALHYVGRQVGFARTQLTSFIASAVGHNLSLAAVTAGAIRFRLYSGAGLSAPEIATVIGFCSLTNGLGLVTVTALSFLLAPESAATLLHSQRALAWPIGALLLSGVLLYAVWGSDRTRAIEWRGWSLAAPGPAIVTAQIALSVVDLLIAALVLWLLLPSTSGLHFAAFAGVFAVACIAGVASHVPAGFGVFESVMVLALPEFPRDQLLASLLAYRLIYYLMPLSCAALLYAGQEAGHQRGWLRDVGRAGSTYLAPIVPQLAGALVFVAGAVLLLSGATPGIDTRLGRLRDWLPLSVLEISHLAGSVIGLGLLILARALFQRSSAAYHITFWLLVAGALTSLLKGLDVEEATYLTLVLLVLRIGRNAFYRPAAALRVRLSPTWIGSIVAVLAVATWIGFLAHRDVEYSSSLWWTFALHADAPRMLRATLTVAVLATAFFAANLLRPLRPEPGEASAGELAQARATIARSDLSIANAALCGDKRLLFASDHESFLMYQISGRSWIALGDPFGPSAAREELVWRFREISDRHGGRTVFYQATADCLPLYIDLGLVAVKIGEEARVKLADFGLEGSARADLRQARRRAERDRATFEVLTPPYASDAALWPQLQAISDAWLDDKATAEKSFSVGAFSAAYLCNFPLALVRVDGVPVAFANLWTTDSREELSIDLMRFGPDAPHNAMDYLFIELMLWGRARDYRWFNLGVAPLSGLGDRRLAPAWHRIGNFVFRHGEHFYNFDGLRRYKSKFQPVWQPRYLVSPGGLALPAALADVSRLIAGGMRRLIAK
jgi:phosphatidylglycerol lysyltransferase